MLQHHLDHSSTEGVIILFEAGKCIVDGLVGLTQFVVRFTAVLIGAGIVSVIFDAFIQQLDGAFIVAPFYHVTREPHHGGLVTVVLL